MEYDFFNFKPEPMLTINCSVVKDFAEFSGEELWEISDKMRMHRSLNAVDVKSHESLERFYSDSKTYIYDILTANSNLQGLANKINKFIPNGLKNIHQHPGKTFADFGAGTGVFCDIITKLRPDVEVHYIDIESYITEFARWRIKKYELPITMHIIPQENFEFKQTYDMLFTDAVWEHLPPDKQISYGTKLANALNVGGLLYMIVDLSGHTDDMPMHYNCDIQAVHNNLRQSGLTCLYGNYNFASVWTK
jgi:cyclopropane fatty-acyl-phospholipid synthase-like methyltransferase